MTKAVGVEAVGRSYLARLWPEDTTSDARSDVRSDVGQLHKRANNQPYPIAASAPE